MTQKKLLYFKFALSALSYFKQLKVYIHILKIVVTRDERKIGIWLHELLLWSNAFYTNFVFLVEFLILFSKLIWRAFVFTFYNKITVAFILDDDHQDFMIEWMDYCFL